VKLGGDTATTVDQAEVTAARLPLFIGAVVVLSYLLLWRAFRAPVIALKASVFTILSILAADGVVAYVAEGGWAGRLIGIDSDLPVPPFIPVMMFAVTFGLARTSKVITAAALIMVSVFGAFALSTELILKLIGVGLASAILIDGILIRMVLLPGVMHLLGERAWWSSVCESALVLAEGVDAVDDVDAEGEDRERPPGVGAADRQQRRDRSEAGGGEPDDAAIGVAGEQ